MNYTQSEITHLRLHDIYQELYGGGWTYEKQNLIELAEMLSVITKHKKPWTWRYIYNLLKNYSGFSITDELARALQILANQLDGQSEIQARGREGTVILLNGVDEYSVILGHTKRCRQCHIKFVPKSANGIYCCPEHKRMYYKEQRNA